MNRASTVSGASAAAARMRKSRDRRRQGGVIVNLEIGPDMTADLVNLRWLPAHVCDDKGAVARALFGLIEQAITMRVTPPGSKDASFSPLRATAGRIVNASCENDPLSPKRGMPAEPGEVLGAGDGTTEIVEEKLPEAQARAEPARPFVVDPVQMWTPRLDLYARARMWMPAWGPQPGQIGCAAPRWLLEEYGIRPSGLA